MKRVILVLVGMVFTTSFAICQDRPKPEEMVEREMATLTETIDVTAAQKEKIQAVLEAQVTKMQEVMSSGDRESGREKMEAIHADSQAKIAEIVGEEKAEKYAEASKKNRPQQGGNGGGGGRR